MAQAPACLEVAAQRERGDLRAGAPVEPLAAQLVLLDVALKVAAEPHNRAHQVRFDGAGHRPEFRDYLAITDDDSREHGSHVLMQVGGNCLSRDGKTRKTGGRGPIRRATARPGFDDVPGVALCTALPR